MLSALLVSCAYLPREAKVPVPVLEQGVSESEELVVMLPGRYSSIGEFRREGFLDIAAERWPGARLVVADLHLGYYENQTMVERLHKDVILPMRRSGVKTIRLVGISMGGMGALIYEIEHPGIIDEIILLSPYLGEDYALDEIRAAGGLENWQPEAIAPGDFSRRLWVGLKSVWKDSGDMPDVFLGCGTEDRLAGASRLFAREFLGNSDQLWIPGAHDWETWRKLFRKSSGP